MEMYYRTQILNTSLRSTLFLCALYEVLHIFNFFFITDTVTLQIQQRPK